MSNSKPDIEPHLLGLPAGTPLRVKAQLTNAAGGGKPWSQDFKLKTADEPAPISVLRSICDCLKSKACTNWTSAINPSLRERLPWKKPLAERGATSSSSEAAAAAERATQISVLEIDPVNPRAGGIGWATFPGAGHSKGPLGNGDAARWDHPSLAR